MRTSSRRLSPLLAILSIVTVAALLAGCSGLPGPLGGGNTIRVEVPTSSPAELQSVSDALATSDLQDAVPTDLPGDTVGGADQAATAEPLPAGTPDVADEPTPDILQPGDVPPNQAGADQAPQTAGTQAPVPTPQGLDRTENILVLGTDLRSTSTAWRTDSIIVVAIDHTSNQVGLISVPRDLYVSIPGYGQERINAADYIGERTRYPGGGPALVRRTLELATGIPTQHYVRLKQDGLIKMIDALGGVTVTLDCPLYEMTPDPRVRGRYQQFTLPAGPNFLDGVNAKKFATYRYVQTNFGRERRQQQLIWAMRNRVMQGDVLPRLPQLIQALSDAFTTDLGLPDIVRLADFGSRLQAKDVHSASIGPDLLRNYTTSKGAMVLLLRNKAALRAQLAKLFTTARPVADVGKPSASGCPAPPRGFRNLNPTPTPRPSPTARTR